MIGLHQQIEQHARLGQPLVAVPEQIGLANVQRAGDQRRIEQRPDRVEVGVELAVGQPAVGGDDRGDQVARLDDCVGGMVRGRLLPLNAREFVRDAVDELGDVSFHRARHESAGYAVRKRPPRRGARARFTASFHSLVPQVFGKAARTLRSACSGGSSGRHLIAKLRFVVAGCN